jgi:hypothetical protein
MSTEHACFVTIDNTQNPYALVLGPWNSERGSFVGTPPQSVPARATLQLELDSTSDFEGPSATLVWITGIAPNQATITMEFADYFAATCQMRPLLQTCRLCCRADGAVEAGDGACGQLAQVRLEFAVRQFDRVDVDTELGDSVALLAPGGIRP